MLPISEQYLKAQCEIKTPDDKLITAGVLGRLKEDTVEIHRDSDALSILHCGTLVKVLVSHQTLEIKVLIGKVFLSSPDLLQITNIQNLSDFERRDFFRLKLNIYTQACIVQQGEAPSQTGQTFQMNINDLSLSGLLMKTRKVLKVDDCFMTTLPLSEVRVAFMCKVLRTEKTNGKSNMYGCSFLDNTNRQFDQLCKFIFEKQREQILNSRKKLY